MCLTSINFYSIKREDLTLTRLIQSLDFIVGDKQVFLIKY